MKKLIFFLIVLSMMIICGAVISDVVKENIQSNNLCSGTPMQRGPDWLSGPPSPLPVTRASHYRVPGGENQAIKYQMLFPRNQSRIMMNTTSNHEWRLLIN